MNSLRFKLLSILVLLICGEFVIAQNPVNGYAKVTAINGLSIAVNNVDETYDSFEDGEQVIIMQMQGADVSDTSNSSSFGTIAAIHSAGLYEIAIIASHTENSGVPDTLKLTSALINNYDVNSAVQIISFPKPGGTGSFTTSADIACPAFDGNKGGVIAFEVLGNLYLANNISADGKGFKGGTKSLSGNNGTCDPSLYAGAYADDKALKGQGVFKVSSQKNSGRACSANGGGGGCLHNGGGAGGGNYTKGGDGGAGWIHCNVQQANGFGGQSMDSWISANRIFLGGGGGGGHDNENVGTNGANGGGIIIIKCDSILSSGSCSSVKISANGHNALSDANDGKGGGGAGGTIVLDADHIKSNATCPLTISANGGSGGNVTISKEHGGGGGGGQGAIMILCGGTAANVNLETKNGKGGRNMTSFQATYAADGFGADNSGIFTGIIADSTPVVFSSFTAIQDSFVMEVKWTTTYEKNISSFELQRSDGTSAWSALTTVPGHGSGVFNGVTNYQYTDNAPLEEYNYYRLKVRDTNGCYIYSTTWSGYWDQPEYTEEVTVYPNPVPDQFYIRGNFKFEEDYFDVYDARGRLVAVGFTKITDKLYKFDTQPLAEGIYFVRYFTNGKKGAIKFSVLK